MTPRCQLFNNSIVFIKHVSCGVLFGTEKRTRKASYCTIYGIDPKVNSGADWWKSCISASFLKIINIFPFFLEYKTRWFVAILEILKWFAGHQIRNVGVILLGNA